MNAHFYDLDALIEVDNNIWLVSRIKPSIPILKITKSEFNLIKKGVYRKYNCMMSIGGKKYWLPENLMNDLKIRCKNLNYDITDIFFSMQEFMNSNVIEHLDFSIKDYNFRNLKNSNDDIYVICSKNSEANYKPIMDKLDIKMKEIGITIKKFYYLSETFYNRDKDNISNIKVKLLLQHLFGLKTESDRFVNVDIKKYDRVYFYDTNVNSINNTKNANNLFNHLISNTEDDIKSKIKDIINLNDNVIFCNYVTNNIMNPFIVSEILITWSNIIKTFEGFSNYKL